MNNTHRYAGDGDTIGMAASTDNSNEHHLMTDEHFNANATDPDASANNIDGIIDGTAAADDEDDAVTTETMQAVTKERQQIHKENAARLQSILENIKHATKIILRETDIYLQETEEVEKIFIRCRANTQKERQRMEQVEPDVIAATQRFMAQGSQFFGGMGGSMNAMNMTSLMGTGGDESMGMSSFSPGDINGASTMTTAAVTPREHVNGASRSGSFASSSNTGSLS